MMRMLVVLTDCSNIDVSLTLNVCLLDTPMRVTIKQFDEYHLHHHHSDFCYPQYHQYRGHRHHSLLMLMIWIMMVMIGARILRMMMMMMTMTTMMVPFKKSCGNGCVDMCCAMRTIKVHSRHVVTAATLKLLLHSMCACWTRPCVLQINN